MQFLIGLGDSYHSIRSNILTTDPLPFVKTANCILSREESHRITSQHTFKKPPASAFNAKLTSNQSNTQNNNIKGGGPKPNLKCTKCQKISHTIDRCYEVVGYPRNYKEKMVNNKINYNYTPTWNNGSGNNNFSSNYAVAESSSPGNMPFYEEQIVVLMSRINSKTTSLDPKANMVGTRSFFYDHSYCPKANMASMGSSCFKPNWIIDYGANQYYTTSESELTIVVDINDFNLVVEHPNGSLAKIHKIGDCIFSSDITLFDVLVVPEYSVNLMSVYKLARDGKKFIAFDEFNCYIQDLPHKGVMGKTRETGSIHGGLYVLDNISDIGNISSHDYKPSCYLTKHIWHNRLGHHAEPVMQVLKGTLGFENDSVMPCDVCHKAKQTEGVPLNLWGDCILTATYLINRTPSSVLKGKSPYVIVYGRSHSLTHLRVFGCLCFATKLNVHDKFGPKSDKCVFIGYSNTQKGYKLYNLDTKIVLISRDVKFYKNIFPFKIETTTESNSLFKESDYIKKFDTHFQDDQGVPSQDLNDDNHSDHGEGRGTPTLSDDTPETSSMHKHTNTGLSNTSQQETNPQLLTLMKVKSQQHQ
ncbi:uncharacterized protein [Rutidosis leptorrhynchoides]|uniref:uncharacterized protein n=1 Tax=Rutidosis leptorrhynchoides TaxID=125765 RepID=UPI003A99EC02